MSFLSEFSRPETSKKKIVFWNTAGSTVNAFFSIAVFMVAARVFGSDTAGDFSIGYAIAQLMWTVGVFESSTYYVTDTGNRFTPEQYFAFKVLSCSLMAIVSVIYVMSFGYSGEKQYLAFSLCAFKLVDAFSSYYYATFQKNERLDISGFSLSMRMAISLLVFTVVSLSFHDVVAATLAATASEILWVAGYERNRLKLLIEIGKLDFTPRVMLDLLVELLPLFAASFLANYLSNVPKYAIDQVGTSAMQASFNAVFMPSFVINLFVLFAIRPTLTTLAKHWNSGDRVAFAKLAGALCGAAVIATAAAELVAMFVGIPVLQLFFGLNLDGALPALEIVIIGGGVYAISTILYNCLVTMRRQRLILLAYALAVICGVLVSSPLVSRFGITGGALTYLATSSVMVITYVLVVAFGVAIQRRSGRPV